MADTMALGTETTTVLMKPPKTVSVRRPEMTQPMALDQMVLEVAMGAERCDQCSAKALVHTELPFGDLWFCMHHYNKNAQALTDHGAVAKLLNIFPD